MRQGIPFVAWGYRDRDEAWAGQEVAGESHHLKEINEIMRRYPEPRSDEAFAWATLVPEPQNKHDRNAVAVICRGLPIGYLPRVDASRYAAWIGGLAEEKGASRSTSEPAFGLGRRPYGTTPPATIRLG